MERVAGAPARVREARTLLSAVLANRRLRPMLDVPPPPRNPDPTPEASRPRSWRADALNGTREGGASFLYGAGRIWTFIIVIDLVWTLIAARRRRKDNQ